MPEPTTPLEIAQHLARRIEGFEVGVHRPNGLIAYWRQPKNRLRLNCLPYKWAYELERRVHERIQAMNEAGPY